ncbi:hypothetical protein DPMN_169950 [Dreissena polymorpha]|uniref:Uncharacterized protein n=1 Tax=Dreissena polymorpha TaxID=45954 RepID=A0A9D4DWZ2_DREPO|nr:hypothetical protein DPMN_169950 [Dreissena polymorpha]
MSRGIFRFTGMIVDLSISISDNFWNYLWAREPAPDVEQTTCIDQSKSVDYDGLLECLKKAYGEQAIYVQKQAVALLRNRYRGNISRFMTDFLMPALEMLILLQERCLPIRVGIVMETLQKYTDSSLKSHTFLMSKQKYGGQTVK